MVDTRQQGSSATGEPIVLSGRYRLVRQVGTGTGRTLAWLAEDQTLARLVEVRILPDPPGPIPKAGSHSPAAAALLDAAQQAGRVVHPRLAAVYDTSIGRSRDGRRLTYVVREWCPGRSLEAVLRDGPLSPAASAAVVRGIADALDTLHAAGMVHGRLHPGNILLSTAVAADLTAPGPFRNGDSTLLGLPAEVKVTDAVVSAALARQLVPHDQPTAREITRLHSDELVAVDTADLARVLYAMLTGRWPRWQGPDDLPSLVADWPGLPTAGPLSGRLRPVRAVIPQLPRAADVVLARALDPVSRPKDTPLRQPLALATAIEPLLRFTEVPGEDPGDADARRQLTGGRRVRRTVLTWGLRLGLLAAIGVAGWILGLHVGKVPGTDKPAGSASPKASTATPSSAPSAAGPQALDLTGAVSAFDPQGNNEEDNASVGKAVDGDPSTGWQTELYYGGPSFGGLKKGVGLLVDLGSAKSIKEVDLSLSGNGPTDVQLLADPTAAVPPSSIEQFGAPLAKASEESTAVLKPSTPTSSRYWLVWLTKLPQSAQGGGWQGEIDEMSFLPA